MKAIGLYGCYCHPFQDWKEHDKFQKQKIILGSVYKQRCTGKISIALDFCKEGTNYIDVFEEPFDCSRCKTIEHKSNLILMDKIKFRAWHKAQNRMLPHEQLIVSLKNMKDDNIWKFMQFVGVIDSRQQEVYQGDFVTYGNSNVVYLIKWDKKVCGFVALSDQWDNDKNEFKKRLVSREPNEAMYVIGNIFEK